MEVGSVNSKHLVLALKVVENCTHFARNFCGVIQLNFSCFSVLFMQVKSVLDPCEGNNVNSEDDNMSLAHESDQDDDFSDTEVKASQII